MIQTSQGPLIARDRPRKMHQVECKINLNAMRAAVINPKTERVEQEFKAHSYVEQFLELVRATMSAVSVSVNNIDAGTTSLAGLAYATELIGATALDRRGILLGSSAAAADITHIDLQGRFAANVVYSETSLHNYTNTAVAKYYDTLRTITSEVDDLDINELGLATHLSLTAVPILVSRDVLPVTVTLMDTEARIFRIRCSFPLTMGVAFVGAFYAAASDTTVNAQDVNNDSRSTNETIRNEATADVITRGIRISSSDIAVAWDDYTIADMYPVTDFYHMLQVYNPVIVAHPNAEFSFYRQFINISGAAQTVRKYGLFQWSGSYTHLSHAALLAAPVVVGIDEGIQITYTFSIET